MKPTDVAVTLDRSQAFESKRSDILRQAAAVFAEKGYHQTSVGSLAEYLGVSKPVLYYYAENKDDLLYQICAATRSELEATIAETTQTQLSGMGKIRRFFTRYVQILGSEFGRCYAMVDHRALEPATREKERRGRREVEEALRVMIRQGQEDGSIRACDPSILARAMIGAFNGIPRWFHPEGPMAPEDVANAYVDIFVNGVGRG